MDELRFRATVKHDGAEVGDLPWLEEFWAVRYDDYAALQARVAELEAANRGLVRLNETTEARAEAAEALLSEIESYEDYDAGLLNDWGGGNVEWWQDYLRAEIAKANEHWRACVAQLKEGRG